MKNRFRKNASALVTTLFVVVVLSTIVMAFMTSMSLERKISKSLSNRYQAELAAEAGFEFASRVLANFSANDHYIVYANTGKQLFIGSGANQTTGNFSYTPLFSTGSAISGNITSIITDGIPYTNISGNIFTNDLPGNMKVVSPAVSWISLTNQSGQTYARFAFWVEDLGGRVDLSVAGGNHTSTNARRPTGTNAAELAVWSFFNTNATNAVSTAANNLATNRDVLLTPATIRLAETSVTTNQLSEFAVRLRHDTNEPEVIPYGFGYANQGQAKVNLNTANLSSIATTILNNLPGFGSRGGALSPSLYIVNIAANIVDYIDADSSPTAGLGYRGVEPIPFLNERGTWYALISTNLTSPGNYTARLTTREYLEFWNLHTRATPAGNLTIQFTNSAPVQYGASTNLNFTTNYVINIPSIPSGSYFVAETPIHTNQITFNSAFAPSTFQVTAGSNVSYGVLWSGSFYDSGKGSLASGITIPVGQSRHIVNPPALGTKEPPIGTASSSFFNAIGDPRVTFYMTNASGSLFQQQISWPNRNTSFGGRNFQTDNTGRLSSEVFMTNWSDLGLNAGIRGTPRVATNTPPALGIFGDNAQASFAPAYANTNTTGRMERITELSHIFDPLQWGEINQSAAWPSEPAAWTNLTSAASPNAKYGGGSTLRIGRPEFTRFTNAFAPNILRASALLDIFAVGQTNNASQVINAAAGRININTASTNALRALAAGVVATNDPGLTPGGTNFSPSVAAVNAFVSAILSSRTVRPFFSPSEMAYSSTSPATWPASAVFGNRALMGQITANDRSTEDWFSKVYSLATVRSRNFLVHVVGQATTTNTPPTILSEQRKTFQVYLQPLKAPTGFTTNSAPVKIQNWGL